MKKINRFILKIVATTFFQPFFEKMHLFSLKGMNYGSANSPMYSGELPLLKLLLNELPINPVIFDVGANNGQYLELVLEILSDKKPIIHSFEPDNNAFRILKQKIGNRENVVLNNYALGEREKKSLLYVNNDGGVDSSLIKIKNNKSKNVEVKINTLDNYCNTNNIEKIHFLKIDVEGFEMNVLKGALKLISSDLIERIQLEHGSIHSIVAGSSLYKFIKILSKFSLFHLKQNGIYQLNYMPKNEIFYNSNYYFKLKSLIK